MEGEGVSIDVDIIQEGRSAAISGAHEIVQTLASTTERITSTRPSVSLCPGVLEIRYYLHHGIPTVSYGSGSLSVAHGPREYVDITDIQTCTSVYAATATELLSKKPIPEMEP